MSSIIFNISFAYQSQEAKAEVLIEDRLCYHFIDYAFI